MYVRALVLSLSLFTTALAFSQVSLPNSASEAVVNPTLSGPLSSSRSPIANMGTVSGVVLSMDGRPIDRAVVELHDIGTGTTVASVQTARSGNFSFSNVPSGEFEVVANVGVDQAHDRVSVNHGDGTVTLRISTPVGAPGSGSTVSVQSLLAPVKAQDEYRKAHQAFLKSKFADAWNLTQKALMAAPRYAQALTLRGILRINKSDLKGGEEDLQSSLKSDPNYGLTYFAMGAAMNMDRRYDEAQRTLEQGLKVQPNSWQGYLELAKSMMGKSDYRAALKNIVKAESLQPNFPQLHLVKAHALMGLKFYDEAVAELEQYIKTAPEGPDSVQAKQSLEQARTFTTAGK